MRLSRGLVRRIRSRGVVCATAISRPAPLLSLVVLEGYRCAACPP
jgi:hypothetical protein